MSARDPGDWQAFTVDRRWAEPIVRRFDQEFLARPLKVRTQGGANV